MHEAYYLIHTFNRMPKMLGI